MTCPPPFKIKRCTMKKAFIVLLTAWFLLAAFSTAISVELYRRMHKEPETVYIEVPQEPIIQTLYVEVEKGPETDCKPFYQAIIDVITDDDIENVAAITQLESGNQSLTGMKAVVEVIFNRVLDERFPDTIYGVLSQKDEYYQFSTWPYRSSANPTEKVYEAIRQVLNESEPILDSKVVYFSTSGRNGTKYVTIGDHVFCY